MSGSTPAPRSLIRERADELAHYWRKRPHDRQDVRRYSLLAARADWLRLLIHEGKATPADRQAFEDLIPRLREAVGKLNWDNFGPHERPAERHHLPNMIVEGGFIPGVTQYLGHMPGDVSEILLTNWLESAKETFDPESLPWNKASG